MQRSKRNLDLLGENATHDIPSTQIDALNRRAGQLHRTDARGAAQLAQEALLRSDEACYPEGQMDALRLLALGALDRADYAAAAELAGRVRVLAVRLGAHSARAAAGVILGICETRAGNFGAALEHHHASLALYRNLGERCGEAEALMYLGGVHIDLTEHAEAHRQLTQALAIFTEEQNLPGQMQARLMLGISSGALGELAAAFQHNRIALELAERQGDPLTEIRVLNNLVNSYGQSGDSDKALECYLRALKLIEVLDHPQMHAALLVNVATT